MMQMFRTSRLGAGSSRGQPVASRPGRSIPEQRTLSKRLVQANSNLNNLLSQAGISLDPSAFAGRKNASPAEVEAAKRAQAKLDETMGSINAGAIETKAKAKRNPRDAAVLVDELMLNAIEEALAFKQSYAAGNNTLEAHVDVVIDDFVSQLDRLRGRLGKDRTSSEVVDEVASSYSRCASDMKQIVALQAGLPAQASSNGFSSASSSPAVAPAPAPAPVPVPAPAPAAAPAPSFSAPSAAPPSPSVPVAPVLTPSSQRAAAPMVPVASGSGSMGLAPAPVSKVQVRFWMKFHVEFGQSLRLVGGSDLLGAWDIDKAPDMTWSDGDLWSLTLEFNPGSVYEYKYVIMENGQPINWQRGANNVLAVQAVDKEIEVYDNWRNAPGAVVLVDGVETTREHKLLAWANDVSTVHTELRRYREELSKAKEEVRMMRAEMSMQQLEVQEARQRSAALERENQDLRQAMASTQAQAHAAMHEAARLLEELPPFEGTPVPKGQQPEMAYAAAGAGNNGNGRGFWDRW